MRSNYKSILLWVMLIAIFVGLYTQLNPWKTNEREMDFSEFLQRADSQEVAQVSIKGVEYSGKLKDNTEFVSRGPTLLDTGLLMRLEKAGVKVRYSKEEANSVWVQLLVQWLPLVVLFLFFIFPNIFFLFLFVFQFFPFFDFFFFVPIIFLGSVC